MTTILRNEPLWNKTTFRIGGLADRLIYPETNVELAKCLEADKTPTVLGGGANMLISDSGIRGDVISLERGFREVSIKNTGGGEVVVTAQAGVRLSRLCAALMSKSVAGLEFATGIPGLIGGALIMNAGTGGSEMKDIVESVTVMTGGGVEKTIQADECGFGYRSSDFPQGCVITEAVLKLREGDADDIKKKIRRIQAERKQRQPLQYPSAGSVFKNPVGDFAGRLIEKAGMKQASVGDAQVSAKHANFIINMNKAKAANVLKLMRIIENKVHEKFGVTLEREIRLVGDFDG
ncbi:UDP-N-acetylenolpyruvoylglucosamine reductase [hydrothermal vent metagenome]|uniref:UDP-N-acetylmuramate dehydrogenase n=2 Tax=hydrothermal vent metagenome TaxID=652676 RepID=A0A3B1B8X0_9ZZZZ